MHAMILSRLSLVTVVALSLAAPPAEVRAAVRPAAVQECERAPDHAHERVCWEQLARTTTADVARTEQQLLRRLERWDQDPPYRQRARTLLLASFRQFASYRAAECDAEASVAAGGNAAGDLRLSCVVRLNRARVADLRSVGTGLD